MLVLHSSAVFKPFLGTPDEEREEHTLCVFPTTVAVLWCLLLCATYEEITTVFHNCVIALKQITKHKGFELLKRKYQYTVEKCCHFEVKQMCIWATS